MATPPSQQQPPPDAPVADATDVYRLIQVKQCDPVDGRWVFQSTAFDNATPLHRDERDDEMSVVLQDILAALSRVPERLPEETPELAAHAPEEWGVAKLNVGFLRNDEGQEVIRSPNASEPAHGDVRGPKGSKRRKRLKRHAEWVVEPALPPT